MTESSQAGATPRLTMLKATIAHTAETIAEKLDHEPPPRRQWLRRRRPSQATAEDLDFTRPYSADAEAAKPKPKHRQYEKDAIKEYDKKKLSTQRKFAAEASTTRPGTLVLHEFYDRTWDFANKKPDPAPVATMLAGLAEANGRVWLNEIEGGVIAGALEQTGRELLDADLPLLAEKAFEEASAIHGKFKNLRAEDRCEYLRSNAHRRTFQWWHPMRIAWALSWSLFGYGYKPMRLLAWIALVIGGFVALMLALPRVPGTSDGDALFMAIQNFVNPMGLGDAKLISASWEPVLEIETYSGDILRNIFFVLLIRRWFRL